MFKNRKAGIMGFALLVAFAVGSGTGWASTAYLSKVPSSLPKSCTTCHTTNIPQLNETGKKFLSAGRSFSFLQSTKTTTTRTTVTKTTSTTKKSTKKSSKKQPVKQIAAKPQPAKPQPIKPTPPPKPAFDPVAFNYQAWASSKHSQLVEEGPDKSVWPNNRGGTYNCAKCHTTEGFKAYITDVKSNPATFEAVYGNASITLKPYGPYPNAKAVAACDACHDNKGLRITGMVGLQTVATPGQPGADKPFMMVNAGKAAACFVCHDYRKAPSFPRDLNAPGVAIRGPHAAAQSELLLGFGGAEVTGEKYQSSPHAAIPNACVTCHMAKSNVPGLGGHTFKVAARDASGKLIKSNLNACTACHPGLNTINRQALGDYDGDRKIEGIQDEIKGLIAVLEEAINEKLGYPEAHAVSTGGQIIIYTDMKHTDSLTHKYENNKWVVDTTKPYWTNPAAKEIYNALFNIFFIEDEGSYGIHNPVYAVQLLQKSYKELTGHDVPNARIR